MQVRVYPINPLAVSNAELYGSTDEATHEWQDGILARIMRTVCAEYSLDQKWILFDGPVDTLWIESMNTLLDDNRLLTLLSGERISMPPQVCKDRLHHQVHPSVKLHALHVVDPVDFHDDLLSC